MAATLKHVSRLAGVALTTVAHAVNATRAGSAAARARLEEAVPQTGRTPERHHPPTNSAVRLKG
jgi:DNA-binding LacI/PurR family transcriptional regulator